MPDPNINRAFRVNENGVSISDEVYIVNLSFNPSEEGFSAPKGSLAIISTGIYWKFGDNDTDWELII